MKLCSLRRTLAAAGALAAVLALGGAGLADTCSPFHYGARGVIGGPGFGHHRPYRNYRSGHIGLHHYPYGGYAYAPYAATFSRTLAYSEGYTYGAYGLYGPYRAYGAYGSCYSPYGYGYYSPYADYGSSYGYGVYSPYDRYYGYTRRQGGYYRGAWRVPQAVPIYRQVGVHVPWRVERREALDSHEAIAAILEALKSADSPGAAPAGEAGAKDGAAAEPAAPAGSDGESSSKRGVIYYEDTGEVVDGAKAKTVPLEVYLESLRQKPKADSESRRELAPPKPAELRVADRKPLKL